MAANYVSTFPVCCAISVQQGALVFTLRYDVILGCLGGRERRMRIVLLSAVFYGVALRWKNYKTPVYASINPH